jgi:hypothetical protein
MVANMNALDKMVVVLFYRAEDQTVDIFEDQLDDAHVNYSMNLNYHSLLEYLIDVEEIIDEFYHYLNCTEQVF